MTREATIILNSFDFFQSDLVLKAPEFLQFEAKKDVFGETKKLEMS